jgi:hypothetical protein
MRKLFWSCLFIYAASTLQAQITIEIPDGSKERAIVAQLKKEIINERIRASQTLRNLIDGSVIVRLKTNQKSIDAYRKNGRNDIADKIEIDRRVQNEKIYSAFVNHFRFCKVYFIYAKDTKALLDSNQKVFLNRRLEYDTTLVMTDTNFIFCEYGSAESFSKFTDRVHNAILFGGGMGTYIERDLNRANDSLPAKTSTSPTTVNGLFFSDKKLRQFNRPFPFVEDVYLDYNSTVRALNRTLKRAYDRLVISNDFEDLRRVEKKKAKKKKKQTPKYNPFQ